MVEPAGSLKRGGEGFMAAIHLFSYCDVIITSNKIRNIVCYKIRLIFQRFSKGRSNENALFDYHWDEMDFDLSGILGKGWCTEEKQKLHLGILARQGSAFYTADASIWWMSFKFILCSVSTRTELTLIQNKQFPLSNKGTGVTKRILSTSKQDKHKGGWADFSGWGTSCGRTCTKDTGKQQDE